MHDWVPFFLFSPTTPFPCARLFPPTCTRQRRGELGLCLGTIFRWPPTARRPERDPSSQPPLSPPSPDRHLTRSARRSSPHAAAASNARALALPPAGTPSAAEKQPEPPADSFGSPFHPKPPPSLLPADRFCPIRYLYLSTLVHTAEPNILSVS